MYITQLTCCTSCAAEGYTNTKRPRPTCSVQFWSSRTVQRSSPSRPTYVTRCSALWLAGKLRPAGTQSRCGHCRLQRMPQCAVSTCRNNHRKTKGRRVRYHRFPAEDDVRSRWVSVCGRSFNTATARVCSLHFSPHSYERDVEHELLGLPPRSRLKRGAVPDRAVPISLPSLIGKWKQPRRQQQVNTSKRGGRKPRTPLCEDEDAAVAEERDATTRFDILLALGLTPINKNHQDGDDYRYE